VVKHFIKSCGDDIVNVFQNAFFKVGCINRISCGNRRSDVGSFLNKVSRCMENTVIAVTDVIRQECKYSEQHDQYKQNTEQCNGQLFSHYKASLTCYYITILF